MTTVALGLHGALDAAGERTGQVMQALDVMAARLADALEAANERLAALAGMPPGDHVREQSVRDALAAAEEAAIQLVETLEGADSAAMQLLQMLAEIGEGSRELLARPPRSEACVEALASG